MFRKKEFKFEIIECRNKEKEVLEGQVNLEANRNISMSAWKEKEWC